MPRRLRRLEELLCVQNRREKFKPAQGKDRFLGSSWMRLSFSEVTTVSGLCDSAKFAAKFCSLQNGGRFVAGGLHFQSRVDSANSNGLLSPSAKQIPRCVVIQFRGCYVRYGDTAALKSFVPGWGQFHNKQYLKGAVFQSLFVLAALSVLYLAMVQLEMGVATGRARALLILGLLIIWEVALFDSYHFAIENRRRDAKRINVEVSTFVSGLDLHGENFGEAAVTRNLSKFGACFLLSKKVAMGTQLDFEFEGKVRSRGRVVWQKETGSHLQNLVGVELLTPLKESFLLGMGNPSTSSSAPEHSAARFTPPKGISGDHQCSAK
jgi:hypothetical protein